MPDFKESNRHLHLTTPLGADALILKRFVGTESISQLFRFELYMCAETATDVPFDQLLGQPVTFGVAGELQKRDFHGIIAAMSQLHRDNTFTHYEAVVVPQLWILTQKIQSRIFQQKSIPDILEKVLTGLDVKYQLQETYEPREYVTQYHESDFAFASRLMEEEGIFYFFDHQDGQKMVVADSPQSHPDLAGPSTTVHYEKVQGGFRDEERAYEWTKQQELRSGKYTLWDHTFEIPHKHLDADKSTTPTLTVGTKTHKLKVAGNDQWEIYEYPGEYAKRFDGIDKSGGEQAAEIQKIFKDNTRTVKLRMQGTETPMILIRGAGTVRHMSAGFKFTLDRHFDANGKYTITAVYHDAFEADFQGGERRGDEPHYKNSFTCIPFDTSFPYRPARTTPRPKIIGAQTAVVVGPSGEEIFTDKYSRIKAQFHWDREGKYDNNSSCWMRVGTPWAGKNWGMIHIPRIGQEVIVEFLEGDPDRPIIVGSVYNAEMMPPYKLPDNKTQSGLKSRSTKGGSPDNFNEIRFEDKIGEEELYIHAEKNQTNEVEKDETTWVGKDRHETVDHDETILIQNDRTETVANDERVHIKKNRHNKIDSDHNEKIGGSHSVSVGMDTQIKSGMKHQVEAGMEVHIKGGMKVVVEAGMQLTLKAGSGFVDINPAGVVISGPMVLINSGGAAGAGSGCNPASPDIKEPKAIEAVTVAKQTSKRAELIMPAVSAVVNNAAQQAMGGMSQAAAAALGAMNQMGQMAPGVAS
ncbi:MAG: type VI secretion system tip protein TssI/VgrG, partial [Bryobacteraceae bacterium]